MDILTYLLSGLVLIALIATMLFVTKAIKAKNDPQEKRSNLIKAGTAFFVYLTLNLARLYVEGKLF